VRRKALRAALEMVSSRTVNDVIAFLKKELAKAADDDMDKVVPRHAPAHTFAGVGGLLTLCAPLSLSPSRFPSSVGRVPPAAGTGGAPVCDPVPGGGSVGRAHAHGLFGRQPLRVGR
jgi:hypothetical protein